MWWVALVAAAVSAGVGAWRARGADARQRAIMMACWRSGIRFSVLNPFPDVMWLPFPLFAPARRPRISNVIWDRGGEVRAFDLKVAAAATADDTAPSLGDTLDMTCAVATAAFSVPRLAVIARDHADPSGLPLHGTEVPLELDVFNRRFLVIASDTRAATAFLDQRMMRAIMALPVPVSIHVNERTLLLTAWRATPGEMLLMLETARRLVRAVPGVTASLYPPRAERGPYERRWRQGRYSHEPTGSTATPAP